MSETIAGYIDRNYIKGQYYKLAGCPKPIVAGSSINFDVISDDILSKAIYAVNGQTAGGTFPTTESIFLITTVEYGNSIYLQTAFSYDSKYEYKRIYSNGSWTPWRSADADASKAYTLAEDTNKLITGEGGINDQIATINNPANPTSIYSIAKNAEDVANRAAQSASGVTSIKEMLSPLGNKIAIVGVAFSGVVNAWSSTGPRFINISGFSSIIAVMPFCDNPGTGTQVIMPYIDSYDTSKITYKLYRPNNGDATLNKYVIKFLIFGTGS